MKKIHDPQPPRGLARLAYRAPLWLYRAGLGGLMGERFLRLTHPGRKSGLQRQNVLEVVHRQANSNTYYVASGYGEKSDWCRNISQNPQVGVQVGRRAWAASAERLPPEQAEEVILAYARRYPRALKQLARLMGYQIDANEDDYRALGRMLPIFALVPI